jgi:hypothetical protein
MAVSLPDGATLSLATQYGAAIAVTAISNAAQAVCTAPGNNLANGDLVEVTSGWSKINGRIVRVSAQSAGGFTLEGIDTSDNQRFVPGGGAGSVRKITSRQQIQQILDTNSSGGEMQFTKYEFLENDFETQLPTKASAQSLAITIADDPTLPGYIALKDAADKRAPRALVVALPNGSSLLYNGIFSLDETPSLTKGQVMSVKSSFSLQSRPVRYAN